MIFGKEFVIIKLRIISTKFLQGAIDINTIKKLLAAVLTAAFLTTISGCHNDDGRDGILRYDISANPQTLDPQQSVDPNSDLIIQNAFTGLLSTARDGTVTGGAARDYTVSEDGLTYNFTLRDDIFWHSADGFEAQCTAKDFVYGFRRLFMPQTNARRAQDYFCIKNAQAVHAGELPEQQLGVRAKGDFELEITLEYPNPRFPAMLSQPPAMPCSEEFFMRSQGKYGLSAECTASNGSFYVKTWDYDPYNPKGQNYLILSRNSKNAAAYDVCPSSLNFFIADEGDFIDDFLVGTTDCIAAANDEKSKIKGDFLCEEFSCITSGLIFNRSFPLFQNEDFVKALSLLADREAISAALPEFENAVGIVPKQVAMSEENYRETAGECALTPYDPVQAQEHFMAARSSLDTNLFTGARVIVASSAAHTAVSYILQEWQKEFGFYCVVRELDEAEFLAELSGGNFEIAITELSGKYDSPAAYLEQFSAGNSENYGKFYDKDIDELLDAAKEAKTPAESLEKFKTAEQELIDKCAFLPLYYKNEYFFTADDVSDVIYDPFSKTVNFTPAKKK